MKKASKLATSPISYFLARCANNDLADIDSNAKKRKKKKTPRKFSFESRTLTATFFPFASISFLLFFS